MRRSYVRAYQTGSVHSQGGQEQTKERTEHGCDHGVDERSVKSLGMNDGLIAI